VVQRGESLRSIALAYYETETAWQQLRDANPERVFEEGALLVLGDTLCVPAVSIANPVPDVTTAPPGGDARAHIPCRESTDYGTYLVFPDAYKPPFFNVPPGEKGLHRTEFEKEMAEKDAQAEAQQAAVLIQAEGALTYGALDWAVTDEDAANALLGLGALPFSRIRPALDALGPVAWARFLENLPAGHEAEIAYAKVRVAHGGPGLDAATLKGFFELLPDAEVTALAACLSLRFDLRVDGKNHDDWTTPALRRLWKVLELLPAEHVQDNPELDLLLRDHAASGNGAYDTTDNSAVMGYGPDLEEKGDFGAVDVVGPTGDPVDVGLQTRVNLFDAVVRHEIGHAVDELLHASTTYATTAPNAGKWEVFDTADAFVDAVIAAAGGMAAHGYADPAAYELAMRKAVQMGANFNDALAALQDAGTVAETVPFVDDATPGPVRLFYTKKGWSAESEPWHDSATAPVLGGRRFHESYKGGAFASFLAETPAKFGVSSYQFRAPGEWFAEAYAVYYSDQSSPTATPVGTRLRTRDAATADWFDRMVDQGHSLQQQTGQVAAATPVSATPAAGAAATATPGAAASPAAATPAASGA
jgi:hypothetical protein